MQNITGASAAEIADELRDRCIAAIHKIVSGYGPRLTLSGFSTVIEPETVMKAVELVDGTLSVYIGDEIEAIFYNISEEVFTLEDIIAILQDLETNVVIFK